jgi:cytochrome c oxidase cbb3-type subunit 3
MMTHRLIKLIASTVGDWPQSRSPHGNLLDALFAANRLALVSIALSATLLYFAAMPAVAEIAPDSALATNNCAPTGELRGDAENGKEIHLESCAECHGYDGKAEVIVMHMDEPPRDQSDAEYMATLNDAFLYLAVCSGGDAVGRSIVMPAWGDVLTDAEIKDLVAWIRTFAES